MKAKLIAGTTAVLVLSGLVANRLVADTPRASEAKPKLAVVVVIDQFRYDYLARFEDLLDKEKGGFARFRHTLAAAVGIDLGEMEMFGGRVPWEMVADPLVPLLRASDVAGRVTALRCGLVAARLRSVLTEHPAVRTALGVVEADGVLAGLEAAAAANEPFEIHG